MRGSRVVIELTASAFEVAVCRAGKVAARRRIVLDRSEWPSPWTAALDDLRPHLADAIGALGCAGRPTTIVYSLPGTFVNVGACPLAAGPGAALRAARLGLASVATIPLDAHPHDARVIHRDPPGNRRVSPGGETTAPARPRLHTVAVADADATVAALGAWAERAGLRVDAIIPAEAVLAAAAVDAATVSAEGCPGPRAVLWMGAHQSVLAVARGSVLELLRTVNAGTETLADALLRPIRATSMAGGEPAVLSLDRAMARRLLATVGVPGAQDPIPDLPGCTGGSLLPVMQPVLQRLSVEIKQSLRFGMAEADREKLVLQVGGEGAGVSGLPETLARLAGVSAATGPRTSGADRLTDVACRRYADLPCLLGGEASDEMMTRGLRRGLIIGACAAAVLLSFEGVSVYFSIEKERQRLEALKRSAEGTGALADVQKHALDARLASGGLARRVSDVLGDIPDWSAVMATLAEQTPPAVRITSLEMSAASPEAVCDLRGYVRLSDTTDAAGEIRRMIEKLSRVPLVSSVRLGATQRGTAHGHDVRSFELAIGLVSVPGLDPSGDPARVLGSSLPASPGPDGGGQP